MLSNYEKNITINVSLNEDDCNALYHVIDILEEFQNVMEEAGVKEVYESIDGMSLPFDSVADALTYIQRIVWYPNSKWLSKE